MKILLATNNEKKLKELKELMEGRDREVLSLIEVGIDIDVEETGSTFVENALIKARTLFAETGLPTLADDSGLVVEALNGAPGVYSARYSGVEGKAKDEANIEKLLSELRDVPQPERNAYFACAIAFISEAGEEYTVEGRCYGSIGFEKRGTNGFGYDPIFIVENLGGRTMAELAASEKNEISHRGNALKKIKKVLELI